MKTISIICPVYNSEKYLDKLIQSIQNQTYTNFECFFIDDKSTDSSLKVLTEINDVRFRVLTNELNMGAQKSREKGFGFVNGDYTVFIDSDDYLEVDYLAHLVNKLRQDDSDIVMCNYKVIDTNNKIIRYNKNVTCINKSLFPLYSVEHKEILLSKPAYWNKMFKTEFLKKYLKFYEVKVAQDLAIVPTLLTKAKISYLDEILYNYRVSQNTISTSYDERLLDIHPTVMLLKHELGVEYKDEVEFIAIGHYFYQLSKTLFIPNKNLRMDVYTKLLSYLNNEFSNYKNNKYFRKRKDYQLYTYFLKMKIIYKYNIINKLIKFLISVKIINKLIRKSDK